MTLKTLARESIPPTLSPYEAIGLILRQLAQFEEIEKLHPEDPKAKKWHVTTEDILQAAFGKPNGKNHPNTAQFLSWAGDIVIDMGDYAFEESYQKTLRHRRALLESCVKQLELLAPGQTGAPPAEQKIEASPLDTVLLICDRFHQVASQLAKRRRKLPTLEITEECDITDLFHALLRLRFDDIRPEEWTPSYAGGYSRTDFLLKAERIVIEVKMTRQGLDARMVSEQLIVDVARYRQQAHCESLVCFVYDPSGRSKILGASNETWPSSPATAWMSYAPSGRDLHPFPRENFSWCWNEQHVLRS